MMVISANNVNDAFAEAVHHVLNDDNWRTISPRSGSETREYLTPVTTVYSMPWRRVLFNDVRDANPFFHLMEALWMLAGRDDAAWISQFSKNIGNYAEDDGHFHGAYGYRWRRPIDQLNMIGNLIRREPETRRAVLGMWNPVADLNADRKDLPCNTHVYFKPRDGKLNMTVCCRSNDIFWGCYGANVVHFSILQEYMARLCGLTMGAYYHVSDSWHYYTDNPTYKKLWVGAAYGQQDYYMGHGYTPTRIASAAVVNQPVEVWNEDLERFFTDDWNDPMMYQDLFFSRTAYPMREAYRNYRRSDFDSALHLCRNIASPDWQLACTQWIQRRADMKM